MGIITDIFRAVGPEYMERFPGLPVQHQKAIDAIINCRSGRFGTTLYQCNGCGGHQMIDRSCGNRHCPQCQYHKSRQWLETQISKRLPGPHFMLTFTVPEALRSFCRSHQRVAYGTMFKTAWEAIRKLARDPRLIGADLPGVTAVLHTWGRQMQYHPHLHLIVPAGGLSKDRKRWLPTNPNFYLPVTALSKIFRAKFKAEMVRRNLIASIEPAVWKIDWNVNSQAVGDSEASLKYLAPYIFRVAISDSRVIGVKDGEVTFSYRKQGSNRPRRMTIDTIEFIRRFLQHVLPSGFMKVRHYGFMSSSARVSWAKLRLMILVVTQKGLVCLTDLSPKKSPQAPMPKPVCRLCGGSLPYLFNRIPGQPCRGPT
jgi:hypothetical protein